MSCLHRCCFPLPDLYHTEHFVSDLPYIFCEDLIGFVHWELTKEWYFPKLWFSKGFTLPNTLHLAYINPSTILDEFFYRYLVYIPWARNIYSSLPADTCLSLDLRSLLCSETSALQWVWKEIINLEANLGLLHYKDESGTPFSLLYSRVEAKCHIKIHLISRVEAKCHIKILLISRNPSFFLVIFFCLQITTWSCFKDVLSSLI